MGRTDKMKWLCYGLPKSARIALESLVQNHEVQLIHKSVNSSDQKVSDDLSKYDRKSTCIIVWTLSKLTLEYLLEKPEVQGYNIYQLSRARINESTKAIYIFKEIYSGFGGKIDDILRAINNADVSNVVDVGYARDKYTDVLLNIDGLYSKELGDTDRKKFFLDLLKDAYKKGKCDKIILRLFSLSEDENLFQSNFDLQNLSKLLAVDITFEKTSARLDKILEKCGSSFFTNEEIIARYYANSSKNSQKAYMVNISSPTEYKITEYIEESSSLLEALLSTGINNDEEDRLASNISFYKKLKPFQSEETTDISIPKSTPSWFIKYIKTKDYSEPFLGYLPWIYEHTDSLMKSISPYTHLPLKEIPFLVNTDTRSARTGPSRLAFENPDFFQKLIYSRLIQLKPNLEAVLLSYDWYPYQRLFTEACKKLNIPTFLIPHEGVFADERLFYTHILTGIDSPEADYSLVWGQLQKSIFVKRGYPENRITCVGTPKFDSAINHKPSLTKEQLKMFMVYLKAPRFYCLLLNL